MIRDTSAQDKALNRNRYSLKGKLSFVFVLSLVVGISAYAYPKISELYRSEAQLDASLLRFATVQRGDLEHDIAAPGRIVAAINPTFYARADGTVTLYVRAGDAVEQGQKLASVDSPQINSLLSQESSTLEALALAIGRQKIELKSQKLSLKQAVEVAHVDLLAAQREMSRADTSMDSHLISDVEYRQIEVVLDKAKLTYEHAKQVQALENERLEFELLSRQEEHFRQKLIVEDLERQVSELTVYAPFRGVVGTIDVEQKQAVVRNAPLLSAVDMSAFEVEVQIPEIYADLLGQGMATDVSIGNETLEASLVAVSPEVNNGQVSGRIRFNQNVDGLRQNQRVNARILIESKPDVLKVKRGPFVSSSGGKIAYKVEGNTANRINVSLGLSSIGEVEVLSGLKAGDRIIISSHEQYAKNERLFITNL